MMRLVLCVGMFAFGYYVGRRSSQLESSMEWNDMERQDQDGV